ncbi:2-dehydropantoate 2-reductase [Rhodobacteraceae bacterium D3-12]|nr:2-dehydropantoate 2-reductase [Rhodobacteraceae bacterium D3-12]
MAEPVIVVAGAGAIGCFVGGLLAAAGRDVRLLARARGVDEIKAHGLTLSDFDGLEARSTPEVTQAPEVLAEADIVLVCVKGGASAEMGQLVARHAPERAVVVSLQNGLTPVEVLRRALPGRDVRAGMVGFNVVAQGQGRYHRSASGEMMVEAGPGELGALLSVPGLEVEERADMAEVQRGKLILNLTNAVNALSGKSLRDMLLDRGWRRVMAAQMREALAVFKAARLEVRVPAAAPAWAIPTILRLPTWAFRRVAAPMLTVDASARTSMVVDLESGKKTEIGLFQGEIVRLGQMHGVATPVNARVADLVAEAEVGGIRQVRSADILAVV